MSFGFIVKEEKWISGEEGELDTREIHDVKLFDVSPVTFPAYEGTDIAVRSYKAYRESMETVKDKLKLKARALKIKAGI
jgi:HK97 family phage prohead protease